MLLSSPGQEAAPMGAVIPLISIEQIYNLLAGAGKMY